MDLEDFFIRAVDNKNGFIGDDAAVVGNTCYSCDAFFENVHFKRSWLTLEQIAYKAMLVNISDAVAMNAQPRYALISLATPKLTPGQMRQLSNGFQKAAAEFSCEIIGGDTIANSKIDISVTIIASSKKPLLRKGLKVNNLLAYTGELGHSKKALRYLLSGGSCHAYSKFVNTTLREAFIAKARPWLACGMDISDGLYEDAKKLCRYNKLGFKLLFAFNKSMQCSGEEYEMLIGFDKRNLKKLQRIAEKTRTPLTIFAKAKRSTIKNRCKANHFS